MESNFCAFENRERKKAIDLIYGMRQKVKAADTLYTSLLLEVIGGIEKAEKFLKEKNVKV